MSQPLFAIRNLSCSYTGKAEDTVLHIDKLDIPRGKLIFLLGASGSGKSTLLETLGMMNNTIVAGELMFNHKSGDETIHFEQLWDENDENSIARIRKQHFSFIFQETNLMENFTAYENICLSQMIQKDVTQNDAMTGAKELMQKVRLPEQQVSTQTLAVNLSGGQRQRLSLIHI